MKSLIKDYIDARKLFIDAVDNFPISKRMDTIFDKWTLKDLLIHIAGWDNCIADNVADLKSSKEPKYYGSVDDFNKQSIENGKSWSWGKAYSEFIKGGERVIKEYSSLPENLWETKFWNTKNATPAKFLKIVAKHYSHEHLPQVLKYQK